MPNIYRNSMIWCLCIIMMLQSCSTKHKADLIIHHARIYTADSVFTVAEAMAVEAGKIIAVGSNNDILNRYTAGEIKDATGRFIYPGFIDAHCHFTGFATDMWKCDLTGTTSFEAVIDTLKRFVLTNKTTWVYGRGWDQNDWPVKIFPNKQKLDENFPDVPVFLKRIDGHAVLVNQKALDMAGITVNTKIRGGSIEVVAGKLTGILTDKAMDSVEKLIPGLNDDITKRYYVKAQEECFRNGLTSVQDCGISEHTLQLVDGMQQSGKLKIRVYALLSDSAQYYDRWIRKGPYKTDLLHMGGFKLYADGALGSRGACLLQDYSDKKGWRGTLVGSYTHYRDVADKLAASGFQLCTHAIGDSTVRTVLRAYADALRGPNDKRWRIEHAQVVDDNDVPYFGRYNIIPSMQPTHATSDMYWAGERLGNRRLTTAYALKKLLGQNGWMPLGTDFPVEYISPVKTFYAAVARKDGKGYPEGGFQPKNALSRKDALRGMTIWAAKAAFEEKEKGSIEPGKVADLVIADNDLVECPLEKVPATNVLSVYISGQQVFSK